MNDEKDKLNINIEDSHAEGMREGYEKAKTEFNKSTLDRYNQGFSEGKREGEISFLRSLRAFLKDYSMQKEKDYQMRGFKDNEEG